MSRDCIVICAEGHLFRTRWDRTGTPGGSERCPVADHETVVRPVDPRMLSQDALAEAWQHHSDQR